MRHIAVGFLAVLLGIWGVIVWWKTFGMVMRGLVPFALLTFGLIAILAGWRRAAERRTSPSAHSAPEPAGSPGDVGS